MSSSSAHDDGVTAEQAAWYAALPSFSANAGALITDSSGAVLLVKASYRSDWTIPGGITEADESPRLCAEREVEEEIGLTIAMTSLLVVHWVAPTSYRRATFGFVFDGGVVHDSGQLRLQEEEIDDYAFLPVEDALSRVDRRVSAPRILAAMRARSEGRPIYLEGGR